MKSARDDAAEAKRAEAFAKYHDERAGYGGVWRDFHERAATFIRDMAERASRGTGEKP
jgi:hypothetical protein